jgi:hypothetical protein
VKPSSLLLALSLAANLGLLGIVVAGALNRPAPIAAAPAPATVPPPLVSVTAAGLWLELAADDLPTQRDKLQADGFPPAMIRAILSAQIRAGFAARRKAIESTPADLPIWKVVSPDPATQAALRALAREEQQALKELLGPDREHGPAAALRRQFPDFSDDAIDQIAAIRERYDQQRSDLYSARGTGGMLPDEQAKVEALEKAMRGEIAAVLSPQDFEHYELRNSNTANQLRNNLVAFDATEAEFRTLHRLQSAFDEQFRPRAGMSEEQMRARSEAQKQLNEQIKAAFGPVRFEEYQRATDYQYRQTTQLVARLELPPQTANQLYAVQKEFEQRRDDLFRNAARGPASSLIEQGKALEQEAIARLAPLLGSTSRVDAYKQYGGAWLSSLVPRPPRPPAPPAK